MNPITTILGAALIASLLWGAYTSSAKSDLELTLVKTEAASKEKELLLKGSINDLKKSIAFSNAEKIRQSENYKLALDKVRFTTRKEVLTKYIPTYIPGTEGDCNETRYVIDAVRRFGI